MRTIDQIKAQYSGLTPRGKAFLYATGDTSITDALTLLSHIEGLEQRLAILQPPTYIFCAYEGCDELVDSRDMLCDGHQDQLANEPKCWCCKDEGGGWVDGQEGEDIWHNCPNCNATPKENERYSNPLWEPEY